MVTAAITQRTGFQKDGRYRFDFMALSKDTKPTVEFDGTGIANGSSYMEMESMKLYFYDQENERWLG